MDAYLQPSRRGYIVRKRRRQQWGHRHGVQERGITRTVVLRCALCLQADSVLLRMATQYSFVDAITTTTPPYEDGFLATNSLLALVILLSRAYSDAFGTDHGLPRTLNQLVPFQAGKRKWNAELQRLCEPLWQKDTLLVLFSPALQAASLDIESKFSEAALGTIQLADFRNFATAAIIG